MLNSIYNLLASTPSSLRRYSNLVYQAGLTTVTETRDFAKSWLVDSVMLHPWWVVGITDAEGCFYVGIAYSKTGRPKVTLEFKVTQKGHSAGILFALMAFFCCGKVTTDNAGMKTLKFHVTSRADIILFVIPFFDQFPLVTSKNLDYQAWKRIALLVEEGAHLTDEGLALIQDLKAGMNNGRSWDQRWDYCQATLPGITLQPEWLQAFIDGEGSFQFEMGVGRKGGRSPYLITEPLLQIKQSNHDALVLGKIQQFFSSGSLSQKLDPTDKAAALASRDTTQYSCHDEDAIMRLLDRLPLYTMKNLDYVDWKRLIELKRLKAHLTPQGLALMRKIKKGMNQGRILGKG